MFVNVLLYSNVTAGGVGAFIRNDINFYEKG